MYKNDNFTAASCNHEMLRKIIGGSGNTAAPDAPCCGEVSCMEGGGSCAVGGKWGLKSYPLASVYAPLQEYANLYEPEAALKSGTLFADLNLPFEGRRIGGTKGGGCRA